MVGDGERDLEVEKETEDNDGVRDGWRTQYEEPDDEEGRIVCMAVVVIYPERWRDYYECWFFCTSS